jgi:hypothetical protein
MIGAPTNKAIEALMTALKAEVTELVDLCGTLEMWVQLNIPKIQDQKQLEESVKEEIVEMLQNGKQAGMDIIYLYHLCMFCCVAY